MRASDIKVRRVYRGYGRDRCVMMIQGPVIYWQWTYDHHEQYSLLRTFARWARQDVTDQAVDSDGQVI